MSRLLRALGATLGVFIALTLDVTTVNAQNKAEVAQMLRVEWQPTTETFSRPALVGFVYNDSTFRIGSVRLRVEALDGTNQVLSEVLAWAYVDVPARGRGAFRVARPREGESFRISVESFVLIARESPPRESAQQSP
jgi:hypothetical protein